MEEYKGNSFKSKERAEHKRAEKVIKGNVRIEKKSGLKKLCDIFVSDDIGDIKSYIMWDVVVPTVKKTISDIITNGTQMILYGGRVKKSPSSKISYREYYSRDEIYSTRMRGVYDYDNVTVDTMGEARDVIEGLDEIIARYGIASVGDFYDLLGKTGSHTDYKYGWNDIHTADIIRVPNGYKIKLPRAVPIN